MNKDAALARLGLSGNEDPGTIARAYGERLSAMQGRLVSAQTDADRNDCQTKLAELVEAYEFVTGTGRYTDVAANETSATMLRSDAAPAAPPANDTMVRMEPGAVLSSRLEVGALLGQGGMGSVYAARDRLKDEDIAIKVLRQDLLYSTMAKDRFLAEAKVSCSLSHPNIVRVHDVGMSGNYYYLSMERLKGQTLRQRIDAYHAERREFSVAEVTDIARQLIDALRYAHRYIVHRDLKPENIWLAEDGTVKLMDFGIARAYSSSQLTQTGMTLGTAYYMAPEQRIAAREVDWRADQYALGVVLYELLAGTLPTGAVTPLEALRRDLPKRYARALMRAMAPKPEDRFASLDELLTEIQAPARRTKVGLGGALLIGAGLAAAAAGAFIVISRQQPPVAPAAVAGVNDQDRTASAGLTEVNAQSGTAQPNVTPRTTQLDTMPPASAPLTDVAGGAAATGGSGGPPATGEPAKVAAAAMVESKPSGSMTTAAATASNEPAANPPAQRLAAIDRSGSDLRREQCVAQCERDDGECRSINRRSKRDCMRAVAFNGSGRLTTTNPASASCAFYTQSRCEHSFNRDACLARISGRYQTCLDTLGGTIASRRQDCEASASDADRLCLDELKDCRAACE